jgi:hypothetical protein
VHIPVTLMCGEFNLRTGVPLPHQRLANGQTKEASQLERLIESATLLSAPVEWNWNSAFSVLK